MWDHSACLRSRVGLCGGRSSFGGAGGGGGRHGQLQCLAIGRTEHASAHHGALRVSLTARPGRFYYGFFMAGCVHTPKLALTMPSTHRAGRRPPAHAQRTSHTVRTVCVTSVFAPTEVMWGVAVGATPTGCEPGAGLAFALGPGGQAGMSSGKTPRHAPGTQVAERPGHQRASVQFDNRNDQVCRG